MTNRDVQKEDKRNKIEAMAINTRCRAECREG